MAAWNLNLLYSILLIYSLATTGVIVLSYCPTLKSHCSHNKDSCPTCLKQTYRRSPNYLTNVNNAINTNCVYASWKIHCGQCSAVVLELKQVVDSHHESDWILSQKCFSLDKISDLLPLSWNWGHVNLHTAPAAFGKQTFSEGLCVAKTAFGRINLEERKPTTDIKHNLGKFFRLYFHIMRPIVYNSLNWAISWLSSSSSLPFYVHRAKFHFQKEIKN